MNAPSPHRIHRQRWLVKSPAQEAAFAIRRQLRMQLDTALLPVFERAFDTLGSDGEVVRIPLLALDLKLRPGEDFMTALAEELRDRLDEVLQEMVIAHPEQAGVRRITAHASRRQTLLNYLATGHLEWLAYGEDSGALLRTLRKEAAMLAADGRALADLIGGSLAQRNAAMFRLLQLLPDELRSTLLAFAPLNALASLPGVSGEDQQDAVISDTEQDGIHRLAPANWRRILLGYLATGHIAGHADEAGNILQALCNEASALAEDGQALLDAISGSLAHRASATFRLLQLLPLEARSALLAKLHTLDSLPDRLPAADYAVVTLLPIALQQLASSGVLGSYLLLRVQALLLALREADSHYPLEAHILALLHECIAEAATRAPAATAGALLQMLTNTALGAATPASARTQADSPDRAMQDIIAAVPVPPIARPSGDTPGESEGYPASDAGVVLLHPFLPRLFDAAGIAPAGTLELPESVLPRAAALLHWLTYGHEDIHEFELATIKVLLGLAPDQELLAGAGLLRAEDRIEADALLEAAISHWDAMGKTSVAGLRMSFLQRRGLLRDTDSGWQLQVEPEPFDLLLGKLPWSISIVRLPWMTKPIFTEWPTP